MKNLNIFSSISDETTFSVVILLLVSFIVLVVATLQWLGYRYVAKHKVKLMILYFKSFLGLSVVSILAIFFNSNHDTLLVLNKYNLFVEVAIVLLFYIIIFSIWIVIMSEWSKKMDFKKSIKGSSLQLLLLTPIFYLEMDSLPVNYIRNSAVYSENKIDFCSKLDCNTDIDSVLSKNKSEALLFQYIDNFNSGSNINEEQRIFEVYQMDSAFTLSDKSLPLAGKMVKDVSGFLKTGFSTDSEEYEVFTEFLQNNNIYKNGLNLPALVNYLKSDNKYSYQKEHQRFYLKDDIRTINIKFVNPIYYEYRFGIRIPEESDQTYYQYNYENGTPFIMQIYFDRNSKVLVIYKVNRIEQDGP